MKTVLRWRFALCLFALLALVHPRAFAQQPSAVADAGAHMDSGYWRARLARRPYSRMRLG